MPDTQKEVPKTIHRPPVNYWSCKARIAALRKYQDLVRHRYRIRPDIGFAAKLEDLIGPFHDQMEATHLVDREIARLSAPVFHILNDVGISTVVTFSHPEPRFNKGAVTSVIKKEDSDLIATLLENDTSSVRGQTAFRLLMTYLEEGIGMYELRLKIAFREIFYPTVWLAYVVRLPLTTLERAGIQPSETLVTRIYGTVIQVLMLIVIVLLSLKLGFTVPWEKIIDFVFKFI